MFWPVTRRSNRWRTAAKRCLTVDAAYVVVCSSIHAATYGGCTPVRDVTPAPAHHAKKSPAGRA
jgi:hypothetical protein